MSGGGTGALVRSLRSSERLRLAAAVVLAGGAVALGESLLGGHHRSAASGAQTHTAGAASAQSSGGAAGGRAGGKATYPGALPAVAGAGSPAAPVAVAGGPAVTRALRHGSMNVVIDQPPGGLFAQQNRSIAQGATIAVDELNAAGGLAHHIRMKLMPESLDGLSAAAVQQRLRADAAVALILPCDTDSQLSQAGAAAQYGMLMLAPCNPDPTAGRRYPTYWPVGMGASDEALGLASLMRTVGYASSFVVSTPGSRYAELLTSYFRSAAQARGIQLTGGGSVATGARDFSGLARAIASSSPKPSTIFTAAPPPLVNRLAAGLKAQGLQQPVVGTTAMDTRLSLSSGATALENAVFPSYGFPREDAAARRFARDYARRFRRAPVGAFPGLGLETIRLLEDAARKARSAEPSAIQQALNGGITLRGVGLADRAYLPGGDHNPVGQVAITKIAFGSLVPLIAIMPSGASPP